MCSSDLKPKLLTLQTHQSVSTRERSQPPSQSPHKFPQISSIQACWSRERRRLRETSQAAESLEAPPNLKLRACPLGRTSDFTFDFLWLHDVEVRLALLYRCCCALSSSSASSSSFPSRMVSAAHRWFPLQVYLSPLDIDRGADRTWGPRECSHSSSVGCGASG